MKLIDTRDGQEVEAGDVILNSRNLWYEIVSVDYPSRTARIRNFGKRISWRRTEQELLDDYGLAFV